jgi:thioredoxin reductase (NADPH)
MRRQAERFGAAREDAHVDAIEPVEGGFDVRIGDRRIRARTVLLATGVVNNRPDMPHDQHNAALARGLIRYCPICDGYEVTDKRIGVIGTGDHGMREALFLRGFSRHVTLIAPGASHDLDQACRARLDAAGIEHVDGPCTPIVLDDEAIRVATSLGERVFDTVYPALGSVIRSELAIAAGALASEDGCLEVDAHQRTSISGLFAAGDVVKGLDQISHAMGEAGVAATTIRNLLDEREAIRR